MNAHDQSSGHAVVDTAMGFVGLAWTSKGLARVSLFQSDSASVERRLARLGFAGGAVSEGDLPGWVAALVHDIRAYAQGAEIDFAAVPVDLSGIEPFQLAIYDAARRLAYGETTTYGELAKSAGHAGLPRETGQALGANPVPLVIPCHRILAAGGKIGGFSAPGGSAAKERMLVLEGALRQPAATPQQSFAF